MTTGIIILTRPGFESDAAQELGHHLKMSGVQHDPINPVENAGWVSVNLDPASWKHARSALKWSSLIFSRQLFWISTEIKLPRDGDRITPMARAVQEMVLPQIGANAFSSFAFETPDEDQAKELSGFCKSLSRPMESQLNKLKLLPKGKGAAHLPRLHFLMTSPTTVHIGFSDIDNSSPWIGGIPRLKFPAGAPSRSTLKLEEAFITFMGPKKMDLYLRPGMTAVDLGASPGGWTFQLVKRGIHVTAIDNGKMDEQLISSGLVTHLNEDAFTFRPATSVDILVCDVVEQPSRITALMLEWILADLCEIAIFNLKLPMKKRWEQTQSCLDHLKTSL